MAIQLIVASPEPGFREFVTEQLAHIPNMELVAEHEEIGANLHIRILHDREAFPQAAVLLDISTDTDQGLATLESLMANAPGMYVILSALEASGEFLLRLMRLGSSDFLVQPLKRAEFHDSMARLEQYVDRIHQQQRQMGKMYTFLG